MAESERQYVERKRRENEVYRNQVEAREAAGSRARGGFDSDDAMKRLVGQGAALAGLAVGVPRGAFHLGKDIVDTTSFLGRLFDPFDAERSPAGHAAWDDVVNTARRGTSRLKRVTRPSRLVDGVSHFGVGSGINLLQSASAPAPSPAAQFQAGLNAGEGAFDTAAMLGGLAEVRSIPELKALYKGVDAADFLPADASAQSIGYMNSLYEGMGMGSHGPLPRATKLPGGKAIPKWLMDSPFNRIMPPAGATRGAFFRFHYAIDPDYWGGPVKRAFGGGGWSGKKLGWTKYGPLARAWYGTPAPTKAAIAGALAGLGWPLDNVFSEDREGQ